MQEYLQYRILEHTTEICTATQSRTYMFQKCCQIQFLEHRGSWKALGLGLVFNVWKILIAGPCVRDGFPYLGFRFGFSVSRLEDTISWAMRQGRLPLPRLIFYEACRPQAVQHEYSKPQMFQKYRHFQILEHASSSQILDLTPLLELLDSRLWLEEPDESTYVLTLGYVDISRTKDLWHEQSLGSSIDK